MRTLILLTLCAVAALSSPRPTVGARIGVQRLSAGPTGNHTCFVRADGAVLCWGSNAAGQIGDGTSGNNRTVPTQVPGLAQIVSVAAGTSHTCALTAAGAVKCWGSNAEGQLGVGSGVASSNTPVDVANLGTANGITAGTAHTCARLTTGAVRCWGRNTNHQLGDGTNAATQFTPVNVTNLPDAITVSAGGAHTCAIRVGGTVVCWGANNQAQTGRDGDADVLTPGAILAPLDGNAVFTAISAGGEFSCARRADGAVFCWGDNDFGQFGNRTISSQRSRPEQVLLRVGGVEPSPGLMVSTGFRHACAITAGSEGLQCWGRNNSGQAGVGITEFQIFTSSLATEPLEVATGNAHTCFLAGEDRLHCFGENSSGQVGNGTSGAPVTNRPQILDAGTLHARSVSAGGNHTCAATSSGQVACWGRNDGFQVAPSGGDRLAPAFRTITSAESVVAGAEHTMARRFFGGVPTGWGDNREGQVRPADTTSFITESNGTAGVAGTYQLSAGTSHGCEVQVRGTLSCRGDNARGQLGPNVPTATPRFNTNVAGITDAVQVASGSAHNCALRASGRVVCWGLNNFGQLGDNTINDSATPRDTGLTNAIAVAVGTNHSCALLVDGRVACWGRNDAAQVDGTTGTRRVPTMVPGIAVGEAVGIAPGFQHTCVLRGTGGVRCWGRNDLGQLGSNNTTDSAAPVFVQMPTLFIAGRPVQFGVLTNVAQIDAGPSHTCVTGANGGVRCWGRNPEGQIGDGTLESSLFAKLISLNP